MGFEARNNLVMGNLFELHLPPLSPKVTIGEFSPSHFLVQLKPFRCAFPSTWNMLLFFLHRVNCCMFFKYDPNYHFYKGHALD